MYKACVTDTNYSDFYSFGAYPTPEEALESAMWRKEYESDEEVYSTSVWEVKE